MTERLIELLGLGGQVPPGATVRFEWGNLPRGESGLTIVIAAALLVFLTVSLYRREGQAPVWRKGLLAALRLLALAAVALVLLEPRLAVDLERTVEGHTIVLWDTSLSMSLPDRYQDEVRKRQLADAAGLADVRDLEALTRHQLALRIVERARLLPSLAAKNRTAVYAFDTEVTELPNAAIAGIPSDVAPKGAATDLGTAVRRALEDTSGRQVAAVVLVTDGRVNRGEGVQGIAAALRRDPLVPVHVLGVGDPTPPKNLEVVSLSAEPRVVLGDPVALQASVRGRGVQGSQVSVTLRKKPRDGGAAAELERRSVTLPANDFEQLELTFVHRPDAIGEFVFELSIDPLGDEPVTDDNEKSVAVKVSDDQTRVLLVAGSPTFEYHFLKTRLVRERTTVVSCWLQSAAPRFPQEGKQRIEALPATIEELEEYDAVVLLDPDPAGFDAGVLDALVKFVAHHKGGLLVAPGPKFAPSLLEAADAKGLRDLLPVVAGEAPEGRAGTEQWPLAATADGADHPAARLDPDPTRCSYLWSRLPGPFLGWPVLHEKAGATVLVRHQDPSSSGERGFRPLLVAHFFEGGPVLWLGCQETWRWRSVAPKVYDRFWVGALRFLTQGRLAGGRKRIELLTDKDEYTLGEPIRLRAHAWDRSYQPHEAAELVARAHVGKEELEVKLAKTGQPGWFEATVLPPAAGVLEVAVPLPDDEPGARPETLTIPVNIPDVEFQNPILDERLLAEIATATSGSVLKPAEVATLADRIPSLTEKLVVAGSPILLWDRWETIALITALLGLEWAIRKRSRMV